MFIHGISLILGLIFLIKGSDLFVKSAASIARKLGVSEFVIGLTLVAVGTSIPELVSSVAASIRQESEIVIGNIVGSNIANIGLIVGLSTTISLIRTKEEMLKRDGYIMLFAALLFLIFITDRVISRIEAVIFLFFYIAYIGFLFIEKPKFKGKYGFKDFILYYFKFDYLKSTIKTITRQDKRKDKEYLTFEKSRIPLMENFLKDFLILTISGFAVIVGADYLVNEAIFFAGFLKISQTLIGISLVAVGTSLPELSVSISAARKGYGDIAIANIIGSNIANILLILGISASIFPLSIDDLTLFYITPFMIFISVLLLIFIKSHWEIRRIEGIIFLILYTIFMTFMFSFKS